MKPRAAVAGTAAVLAIVALAAGCGGTSDRTLKTTLAALRTQALPEAEKPSPPSPKCTPLQLRSSLRPPTELPRPGHMPPGSFMETIYRRGRLVAGVNQNYLLLGYLNPRSGRIEGFEIDLMREIARAIFGTTDRVEWKALTVSQRIPYVQRGRVDIVADEVTITCGRRTQVDFSTVYYDAGQRVLVQSDSRARSLDDLGGKRVCATDGSTPYELIAQYRSHPKAYPAPTATDCLVLLQEGRIDAISTDEPILLGFRAQDPYTKIVGRSLAPSPYGVAISKAHPEFVRFVNGVLARLRADGTWSRIYHKWLGRSGPTPPPPRAVYNG
jgi:polar amino acid transport system substrate-binding protein